MQDTSPVEFVVRIGGENVAIDLADLLCIRVNGSDGRTYGGDRVSENT